MPPRGGGGEVISLQRYRIKHRIGWEETHYRLMLASRPRRIREAVQALIVEGVSPEEYAKRPVDLYRI